MQRDTAQTGIAITVGLAMTAILLIWTNVPALMGKLLLVGSILSFSFFVLMLIKGHAQPYARNIEIWKAVAYVADRTGDTKESDYFRKTRAEIEERAASGELLIWGRKQLNSDPEWVETRKFSDRFDLVPAQYWAISKIAPYAAVEPVSVDVPYTQPGDRGAWPKQRNAYADLRVNWRQIKKLWP